MNHRRDMFHWRGKLMPGWVCEHCNSLWDIGDRFMNYVKEHQ